MSPKKAEKIRKKLEKKKEKKRLAKKKKAQKKEQKKAEALENPKPKKSLAEILDMIVLVRKLIAKVVGRFAKHLRIDIARLKIRVATGDAANTAIAYGAITQGINLLFPLLEKVKNFDLPKAKDIDVVADFTGESIEADVRFAFSLRVWHVFDVAFGALFTFIAHLWQGFKKKDAKKSSAHKPPKSPSKPRKSKK